MRLLTVFLFVFSAFTICAKAQNTSTAKRATERDEGELTGPVHYVRIRRELVKSTDGKGFEGGWIPSLTIYNRNGSIRKFLAYDDKGSLDYKTVGKFDSFGNKIEEDTYRTNEKLPRKRFMAYDARGNIIENKDYNNYNGVMSEWQRFSYNRRGYVTSISYSSKDGQVLGVTKYLYNHAGKKKEENAFDKSGNLRIRTLIYYHKKNEEVRAYDNWGMLEGHNATLVNSKGDQTVLVYGKDEKPIYKARYIYKQRDSHRNWTTAVCSEWEAENGQLIFKRTKLTRRIITYF